MNMEGKLFLDIFFCKNKKGYKTIKMSEKNRCWSLIFFDFLESSVA